MPTWGEILAELKHTEEQGVKPPFDAVRRKYLATAYKNTGRNTYFTQQSGLKQVMSILKLSVLPMKTFKD